MAFEAGTFVTPSVRLMRPLGAGGMGAVWVADHVTLRTQVVVKFMSHELSKDPASIARFSREAASASNVKSPHVVQMLDHGVTDDGVAYIVMELLEGSDLAHRLRESPVLSLDETGKILVQACKALGRAHERGIVHRDIKPDNIFLCNVGDADVFVKLLDFGIAKANDGQGMTQTKTGAVMGTPYYMSPEQAIGLKTIDHRTDLWSLGVVAFEALTGRRPFEADNIGALVVAIHSGPIPTPSHANPTLSPAIDAWFFRACSRDVTQRFSSAKEMSDAFESAVRNRASAPSGSAISPYAATHLPESSLAPGTPRALSTTGGAAASTQEPGPPRRSGTPLLIGLGAAAVLAIGGVTFAFAMLKPPAAATPLVVSAGASPAPSIAGGAQDVTTPEQRALQDAKTACSAGDCDRAHTILSTRVAPDSPLRNSAEFDQVESDWAESVLGRADHESDIQKKKDLLSSVAQASGVRALYRQRAQDLLARLQTSSPHPVALGGGGGGGAG